VTTASPNGVVGKGGGGLRPGYPQPSPPGGAADTFGAAGWPASAWICSRWVDGGQQGVLSLRQQPLAGAPCVGALAACVCNTAIPCRGCLPSSAFPATLHMLHHQATACKRVAGLRGRDAHAGVYPARRHGCACLCVSIAWKLLPLYAGGHGHHDSVTHAGLTIHKAAGWHVYAGQGFAGLMW
jgi:hypothetical protein